MSITPESVGALLNSQNFGDRLQAINQIRQLAPEIGFQLIQSAVTDSHPRVRYAAVSQLSILGQQDPAQASILLRGRLHDSEPDVQAAAADSIGALKLTEIFEDLQQLYNSTSEWLVKFSIVATLGELGDKRGFDLLQGALTAENELLQMVAVGSLGELGDPRAIQLLKPFVANSDWQIRLRVAQALNNFKKDDEVCAILEVLAQDPIEVVAEAAKGYLNQPG